MDDQNKQTTIADDQNSVANTPQADSDDQTPQPSTPDDAVTENAQADTTQDQPEVSTPTETEKIEQPETSDVESNDQALEEPSDEGDAATETADTTKEPATEVETEELKPETEPEEVVEPVISGPRPRWYVVHTYSGHENRVAQTLKQRVESEHLESKILDVLVPTQDKIEIRSGKKETVKEKIFPGYILVKMLLDDDAWLAVRTTQGVTSFVGMGNKPTAIPDSEVNSIVKFMQQGAQPTYKQIFSENDTVKIVDGPFSEFIGKVESVDKERGKVKVLVSIFGRETPVELDFLQVQKL